ncbi:N-alpha-acetyltransferase 30 [Leucoagaricus gongylophorus]
MALVQNELSEPYVIYTFRYFLHQWPHLSFLAFLNDPVNSDPIGVIVCKQSMHRNKSNRGYIAMLSVDRNWRKRGIASTLVRNSIQAMKDDGVDEVCAPCSSYSLPFASLSITDCPRNRIRQPSRSVIIRISRFHPLVLAVPPSDDTSDASSQPSSLPKSSLYYPPRRAINVIPYSDGEDDHVSGR